jgi:N-acetyl-gamma-glutamyl-phosphate reductase
MDTVKVVIVGASGYTGEELVRWLLRHPYVELVGVTSRQFKGKSLIEVLGPLPKTPSLIFEDLTPAEVAARADVVFLALPHGVATEFAVPLRQAGKIVIDLSADFRLRSPAVYQEFYQHSHPAPALLSEAVYANPTLHREAIRKCDLLAAPGCYPTGILLALAPALQAGLINPATLVISSLSGVSGAGKKAELTLLYSEVNENMRTYNVPKHRHLSEIEQEIALLGGSSTPVTFVPHLVPLTRGILTTISAHLKNSSSQTEVQSVYENYYRQEPFIQVLRGEALPESRRVAKTNWCEVAVRVDTRTGRLLMFSAIDNLVRGAGGQAIQAMNIRLGFPEETGLTV